MNPRTSGHARPVPTDVRASSRALAARLAHLPVRTAGPDDPDPTVHVAALALDGCLLGLYGGIYPGGAAWRTWALTAIARYVGVAPPDVHIDAGGETPYRSDEPLLDTVLRLAAVGGVEAVTLDRVARTAGRDLAWLSSAYGSTTELLDTLLLRVLSEGFDDLVPMHLTDTPAGVRSMLDVLGHPTRAVSALRGLLLSGVTVSECAAQRVRSSSAIVTGPTQSMAASNVVVGLALDGWTLAESARGYERPPSLPAAVVVELTALARR